MCLHFFTCSTVSSFNDCCSVLWWRGQGDRLRLIRLDRSREDGGRTAVLELKNLTSLELVRLPLTYTATFKEAQPPDRLYTIGYRLL